MEMSLPTLSTKLTPRYPIVPRRYEETRPVVVQDFTHRRILGFGNEIHRKQIEQIELEKLAAIRKAEEAVWKQAEELKESSVEAVKKQAQLDQEKIIRKMMKDMDKKLKEEGLKVEMTMQKLALEQVREERAKCENALQEAVKLAETKAENRKKEAVTAVQTEERKIAESTIAKLFRTHEEDMKRFKSELELKHKHELEALVKQKDLERERAVKQAHEEEQSKASEHLQDVKVQYDNQIKDLNAKIDSKVEEILTLQEQIQKVVRSKKIIAECLIEMHQEFKKAMTRLGKLTEEQINVFMPSLCLEELEDS